MVAIEQERRWAIRNPGHPSISIVRDLIRLKSIQIHTAWPLAMALFALCQFRNSREIGVLIGLITIRRHIACEPAWVDDR